MREPLTNDGLFYEDSSVNTSFSGPPLTTGVHGFAYSQLTNSILEQIAESEQKADAPPDRLQLFFSTHDVTLTGWRLSDFLRLLRDGKVAAVKTGDARYANLRNDLPFVAEIKIAQVKAEA
jgi:hypothetical protein